MERGNGFVAGKAVDALAIGTGGMVLAGSGEVQPVKPVLVGQLEQLRKLSAELHQVVAGLESAADRIATPMEAATEAANKVNITRQDVPLPRMTLELSLNGLLGAYGETLRRAVAVLQRLDRTV